MTSISPKDGSVTSAERLDSGWQFRQGAVGGIAAVWDAEKDSLWQTAILPHCFNEHDAYDPDQPYFRGQGW
jgi:beta-galactosidase